MEKRQFGKTGMEVTALGFGGAEIGYEKADEKAVSQLLNCALDAGLNVIDTAECYFDSEEKIGRTVSHRRDEFYLFSKCGHTDGPSRKEDYSRQGILRSIERSLRRLKTDRLDLIHLHSCSEQELRKGECIEALKEAREKGMVRFIGYSGDSTAAKYAVECGAFDTLQTSINIADQESVELTVPLARQREMGVIAKRPIANAAWKYGNKKPSNDYHVTYWERLQKLQYDFLNGAATGEAVAKALRFTLSVPGVHIAIVGTKKPGRWSENARALQAGPLPPSEFEKIRGRWNEVAEASWVGQI